MGTLKYFLFSLFLVYVHLSNGNAIQVNVDTSQAPDLADFGEKVKNIMEENYPRINSYLWSNAYEEPNQITVQFREDLEGVNSYTYPTINKIIAKADYFREYQNDTGSFIHELVHVMQQYKRGCPAWIYEGVADYIRYYQVETDNIPKKPMEWANEHYSSGYRPAAYFLWWLHEVKRTTIFHSIHSHCRNGTYEDDLFKSYTGQTLQQNWEEMIYSEAVGGFRANVFYEGTDLNAETKRIKEWFEKLYPGLKDFLFSPTFEELDIVDVQIEQEHPKEFVSVAPEFKTIMASPDFIRENKPDVSEFLNGFIRIMQQYRAGENWVTEGIARLAIYKNYYLGKNHFKKPSADSHYTDGNWVAGYFLNWLDKRYKPDGQRLTFWLNKNSREGTYTQDDWKNLTGKTVDELWEDFRTAMKY